MNKEFKKRLLSLLLALNTIIVSGCVKNIKCDVKDEHMHVYTSEMGIDRYAKGEKEYLGDGNKRYYRTEDYVSIDNNNKDEYNLISNNNLVSILDNKDILFELSNSLRDYYQFEYYTYEDSEYTTTTYRLGNQYQEVHRKKTKKYNWTTDPNHSNLTGKYTVNTHVFYGYNIVRNSNGKYELQKSGPVDSIELLIEMGYKYVDVSLFTSMRKAAYYKQLGISNYTINDDNCYVKQSDYSYSDFSFSDGYYSNNLESDIVISDDVVSSRLIIDDDDDDYWYSWSNDRSSSNSYSSWDYDYSYDWDDDWSSSWDYDYSYDWDDDWDVWDDYEDYWSDSYWDCNALIMQKRQNRL